jgi:hypothetical protein
MMAQVLRAADCALDPDAVLDVDNLHGHSGYVDGYGTADQVLVAFGSVRAEPDVERAEPREQREAHVRGEALCTPSRRRGKAFSLLCSGQMSKSSVVRADPSSRSATPPITMKRRRSRRAPRAAAAGAAHRTGQARSRRSRAEAKKFALLLEAAQALLDRAVQHALDQLLVVRVARRQLHAKVEAGGLDQLLDTRVAGLLASHLDAGDLGLRDACAVGQRSLAQPRSGSRFPDQRPGRHTLMMR